MAKKKNFFGIGGALCRRRATDALSAVIKRKKEALFFADARFFRYVLLFFYEYGKITVSA